MSARVRVALLSGCVLMTRVGPMHGQATLPDTVVVADSTSGGHPVGPLLDAGRVGLSREVQDTVRRPRAIEYSDAYNIRLTIHRYASYVELPLFAAEYIVGQKLLTQEQTTTVRHSSLRSAHNMLAGSLGALFAVNTVTGLWNLYDSRHDPAGRARRMIHSIAMLAADAGFSYTAAIAGAARRTDVGASNHRSAALVSMGVATASTLMMWLWKN